MPQNNNWKFSSLDSSWGLFNWHSLSINIGDSSEVNKYFSTNPYFNLGNLREIKNKFDVRNKEDLKLIRTFLVSQHEYNHFLTAVGTSMGITAYAIRLASTTITREIIRAIGKECDSITIPLQPIKYSDTITFYTQFSYELDTIFSLLFEESEVNPEFEETKKIVTPVFKVSSQQSGHPMTFPDTPVKLSTNRIFEAIATLNEMIMLEWAGYNNTEIGIIIGGKNGDVYYSIINFLFKDYNFDHYTAKLALELALLSPFDPYCHKKNDIRIWEDTFPAWRLIRIANAIKKIGPVTAQIVLENTDLENYINKICDVLSWPCVSTLFDMDGTNNSSLYRQASENWIWDILQDNPLLKYLVEMRKLSSKISKISTTYRFFGFSRNPEVGELKRRLKPPFIIYLNEVQRPCWLDPEKVDAMFPYYLLTIALEEMYGSKSFEFTEKICEIWFGNKRTADKFLDHFWQTNFNKPREKFRSTRFKWGLH